VDEAQVTRCRTFRFRLHPTYRQAQALIRHLDYQRELYNAALEERIGAWEWERRSVSFYDQCLTLTGLREVRPEVVELGVTVCRGTLERLDRAFAAFFRRKKLGEKPGYRRFKSVGRFHSLQWEDKSGWRLKTDLKRLYIYGIGDVKVNYYRALAGTPKAITVKREGKKWWLSVRCVDVPPESLKPTRREVGIDLGVVNLTATSEGEMIIGPRFGARSESMIADAQRKLELQKRGSNRRRKQTWRVAQLRRRATNQRLDFAHKASRRLVNKYDLIVLEDLAVSNMVRRPRALPDVNEPGAYRPNGARAKARLNNSIHDAGWGTLVSLLSYKAESAGRILVKVDPRHTSQTRAECGHVNAGNRINQAEFRCRSCGHFAHADLNAARNILRAGRAQQRLVSASVES